MKFNLPLLGPRGNVVATVAEVSNAFQFRCDADAFHALKNAARHARSRMTPASAVEAVGMKMARLVYASEIDSFILVTLQFHGGEAWSIVGVNTPEVFDVLMLRENSQHFYPFAGRTMEETVRIAQEAARIVEAEIEERERETALADLHMLPAVITPDSHVAGEA